MEPTVQISRDYLDHVTLPDGSVGYRLKDDGPIVVRVSPDVVIVEVASQIPDGEETTTLQ